VIVGGKGADLLRGGGGYDSFYFALGDSQPVIGGTGLAGTITGFDVITDFNTGDVTGNIFSDTLRISSSGVSASIAPVSNSQTAKLPNGVNLSLLHSGTTKFASHQITSLGVMTFSSSANYNNNGLLQLNNTSQVAASVICRYR
jgi:Ca2+-binding RTX toxin-like protein